LKLGVRWKAGFVVASLGWWATSCTDLGFQGGVIPTNFQGITSLVAISPESVQMTWDPYPGATQYKVYTADLNDPLNDRVGFTTFITKPIGSPREDGSYLFSATAVDPSNGLDQGDRSNYLSVKLLPRFNYHLPSAQGGGKVIALNNPNPNVGAIRVSWTAYPLVTYQVFISERQANGSVNFNFNTSSASVNGAGSVDISGLLPGRSYCAVVVANYLDATRDGPNGQKLTTPLSTLMVGSGGGFGGSVVSTVINDSEKCVRTSASSGFASTQAGSAVYSSLAVPSTRPTFFAVVGQSDSTENGSGDARVTVYREDPVTKLGTLVGERIGFGRITAISPLPQGRHKFYAILEDLNSPAQARLEIRVGGFSSNSPAWMFLRGFSSNADSGNYPELQQRGYGSTRLGTSVAMGDFNCDGKADLAIGMPEVSETLADNRTAKLGRVMIYYDIRDASNILPCTRSQSITFDISDVLPAGRDLRLGTELFVGNFNRDTQKSNSPPDFPDATLKEKFSCDDLAIGSGYGPLFVLYGRRDTVGSANNSCTSASSSLPSPKPDGGLNYLGPKSFTQNPSNSCPPNTGICGPALFRYSDATLKIGVAMTSGDFDGDGYPDLAASSRGNSGIWVLRGSEYGLIPPSSYSQVAGEAFSTNPGTGLVNFPYLPATRAHHLSLASPPVAIGTPVPSWATGNFGVGIGVLKNAYYDKRESFSGTPSGTSRVRDVLLIGNPSAAGGGEVIACIPKTAFIANDTNGYGEAVSETSDSGKALAWDCGNSITPPTGSGASEFGSSLSPVENALRYSHEEFRAQADGQLPRCLLRGNGNDVPFDHPNCAPGDSTSKKMGFPGAVAIGAPGSNQVFVFYGLHRPYFSSVGSACGSTASACTRDQLGVSRNRYLSEQILTPATTTVQNDPCSTVSGIYEQCSAQMITQPPATVGGRFGTFVTALRGNNEGVNTNNPKESILAVTAPTKSVTVGSATYREVGAVQVFQQKSVFSNNPILGDGFKRFSTGLATSLTSTIDYDGPLNDFVQFGRGGIAAGPMEASVSGEDYAAATDLVIGAPGFVRVTDAQGVSIPPVYDSGAAFVFFSHGGTYRNFRVSQPGTGDSKWHILSSAVSSDGLAQPIGQESDTRFHHAISIGDVDRDGIGDVAVRISRGSTRNSIRIYPGAECTDASKVSCQVGIKKGVTSVTNLSVPGDSSAGFRFVPAGRLKGGTGEAFFITGTDASYLFFGGTTGIIPGVPSNSGSPRKFERASGAATFPNGSASNAAYLSFSDSSFFYRESISPSSTLNAYLPFARGDFNGDGFQDFAYAQSNTSVENAGIVYSAGGPKLSSQGPGPVGSGRVYVWYGGADNGFQPQVDTRGGYPAQNTYTGQDGNTYGVAPLSQTKTLGLGTGPADELPCGLVNGSWRCNRIQMIAEVGSENFGSTLMAMPIGKCGNNDVSALVVRSQAGNGSQSKLYVYRPYCITSGDSSNLNGLALEPAPTDRQFVNATVAADLFGVSGSLGVTMAFSDSLMGSVNNQNLLGHLVLADQSAPRILTIPVERANANTGKPSGTLILPNTTDFPGGPTDPLFLAKGGRVVNFTGSTFLAGLTASAAGFGEGMANIGDYNGDGAEDIAVNVSKVNRIEYSTTTPTQGGLLLLFGKVGSGLQVLNSSNLPLAPDSKSECYMKPSSGTSGPLESICNPMLLFAPQPQSSLRQGAYEMTFLSPYSRMSTGTKTAGVCQLSLSPNECLGSFVFGIPGRDSLETPPNRPILQGGVFYVAP
jgi:hypothetical protein